MDGSFSDDRRQLSFGRLRDCRFAAGIDCGGNGVTGTFFLPVSVSYGSNFFFFAGTASDIVETEWRKLHTGLSGV